MASESNLVEELLESRLPCDLRITQAVRLIDRGFNDHDLTVARLAGRLHLSPSRLRQLFVSELGVAPKSYIRKIRLKKAQRLLTNASLSIKEVMASVGFKDPSDFSRAYKRVFGVTPSVYRDSLHVHEHSPGGSPLVKWPTDYRFNQEIIDLTNRLSILPIDSACIPCDGGIVFSSGEVLILHAYIVYLRR